MHLNKTLYSILGLAFVLILAACNTPKRLEFLAKTYKDKSGLVLPYQLYYPKSYGDKDVKSPLLIFLHGAGERGDDNKAQLVHVVPYLTSAAIQTKFNFLLYIPQCPAEDYWAPVQRMQWQTINNGEITPAMNANINMITKLLKDPHIDKSRVYIVGLSMGGFGTNDLLSRKPEWFAAAIPICGGADLTKVENYLDIPLWIFHGAQDNVVPVQLSEDLYKRRKELEAPQTLFHIFPNGNHGVWEQSISYPNAMEWLFAQKKHKLD